MTTLEQVIRPNESPATNFGSGHYSYIRKKADSSELPPDTITYTIEASTSTMTTEIKGVGYSVQINKTPKYIEVKRDETQVEITNPDDETQVARFAALKALEIQDTSTGTKTHIDYAHPSHDNSRMIPAKSDEDTPVSADSTTANPKETTNPEAGSYGTNSVDNQIVNATSLNSYSYEPQATNITESNPLITG